MDQVQKTAIVETAKTVGAITVFVIVVSAVISMLSLQAIVTILMVYVAVMCIKLIYDTQLNQARVKQAEIDAEIDRLHK
jgi:hypothetical protein